MIVMDFVFNGFSVVKLVWPIKMFSKTVCALVSFHHGDITPQIISPEEGKAYYGS